MKKISILILLSLLTFSLSNINLGKNYVIFLSLFGISDYKGVSDLIFNNLKKLNIKDEKSIENLSKHVKSLELNDTLFYHDYDYFIGKDGLKFNTIQNSMIQAERLKGDEKNYIIYSIISFNVKYKKPPKIVRECKKKFLIKKCKNVEVPQSLTLEEVNEIVKIMKSKAMNVATINLPKENYDKYKQILRFKYPDLKF